MQSPPSPRLKTILCDDTRTMAEYRKWKGLVWPYVEELFSNEIYVFVSAIAMNALFSFTPFVILIASSGSISCHIRITVKSSTTSWRNICPLRGDPRPRMADPISISSLTISGPSPRVLEKLRLFQLLYWSGPRPVYSSLWK